MAEDKDPREEALWEYANEKVRGTAAPLRSGTFQLALNCCSGCAQLQGMLQPMMEDLFLARPDNPAEVRARPAPAPALRRSARAPRLTRRPPPACATVHRARQHYRHHRRHQLP